ncbi:MAG: polysaccharide biosynthesis C-terminal domain-containing protein, partial [Lachnospiraceae bacterium]|nr:polysaccharide biosynthesis C-terminal domain-containing protein [Lachnospiraceae bacterium]
IFIGWYLPQALSKSVRIKISRGQVKNAGRVLTGMLIFAVGAGLLFGLLTVVFSRLISDSLLLQPLLSLSVCVIAPTFLLSSVISVYRGYFEGIGTVVPTCISKILEQIFNLGFGLIFARMLYHYGEKAGRLKQNVNCAPAYGVAGMAIGMIAAQVLILLFLLFLNRVYAPALQKKRTADNSRGLDSYAGVIKNVLFLGIVPFAMLFFVQGAVFIDMLLYFHYTHKNTTQNFTMHYGSFYGKYGILMGILVCLICLIMIKPLAAIGQFHRREDYRSVKERFAAAIHAFCIYAVPVAILLAFLAKPITDMLFGTVNGTVFLLQVSSTLLFIIPCGVFFNYVLQAVGKQSLALRNCAVSFVVHLCAMILFLKVMHLGIASVAYGYMVLFGTMMILNGMTLFNYLKYTPEYVRMLGIPVLAAMITGLLDMLLARAMLETAGGTVTSIVCILLGAIGYIVLLFALRGVNKKELLLIPGGSVLTSLGQMLRLL